MKNYPLLQVARNGKWDDSFKDWTNNYLKELNDQIIALHHYSEFFIPDYKKTSALRWDIWDYANEDVYVSDDRILRVNKLSVLPYHVYAQLNEAKSDILVEGKIVNIRQGSYIISRARAEGQIDNEHTRDHAEWFFWQPSGWASYYEVVNDVKSISLVYNKYAEERYGLNYIFSYIPFSTRFFYIEDNEWKQSLSAYTILNLDTDKKYKPLIVDKAGLLWMNISKPPMYQEYIDFGNNEEEELCADVYFKASKLENANVTSYNIVFRNGDSNPLNETVKVTII